MKPHIKGEIGEDAVNLVVNSTYFKYWCFPSPKNLSKSQKEICDLLILFKKSVIIISIKNYEFKGNYERYFRQTLGKAISQIHGAERILFNSDVEISFNHPLTGLHIFDPNQYGSVHRIVVNLNTDPLFHPGSLTTKGGKFVHIFNWFAFLKLVNELDTLPDLLVYLLNREVIFRDKQLIMVLGKENDWTIETKNEFLKFGSILDSTINPFFLFSGSELDLLSYYFTHGRRFPELFNSTEGHETFIQSDGTWEEYINRKEVIKKKEEDEISYFIDKFIEKEVLFYDNKDRISLATELLSLDRFERRIIGKQFMEFFKIHQNDSKYYMGRRFGKFGNLIIAFFIHSNDVDKDNALKFMRIAASGYIQHQKVKSGKLLMIGNNMKMSQSKFLYIDQISPLEGQEEQELLEILKKLKWFTNLSEVKVNEKEYPDN